jgi:hypothetical protein
VVARVGAVDETQTVIGNYRRAMDSPSGPKRRKYPNEYARRAMGYGKRREARALAAVAEHLGVTLTKPGPCKSPIPGAPDAVVDGDPGALVKVKCPFSLLMFRGSLSDFYAAKPNRLIRNGRLNYERNKQAKRYYRQCQMYLLQRDAHILYFGVWTLYAGVFVITITPDPSWREDFCIKRRHTKRASSHVCRTGRILRH